MQLNTNKKNKMSFYMSTAEEILEKHFGTRGKIRCSTDGGTADYVHWLDALYAMEEYASQSPSTDNLSVLKEIDDYLSETIYERGKPIQLNSIGAGSILHQKVKAALLKKGNDEPSSLRKKMDEYFKNVSADYLIKYFTELGYDFVPNDNNSKASPVASHTSGSSNSIRQIKELKEVADLDGKINICVYNELHNQHYKEIQFKFWKAIDAIQSLLNSNQQ